MAGDSAAGEFHTHFKHLFLLDPDRACTPSPEHPAPLSPPPLPSPAQRTLMQRRHQASPSRKGSGAQPAGEEGKEGGRKRGSRSHAQRILPPVEHASSS